VQFFLNGIITLLHKFKTGLIKACKFVSFYKFMKFKDKNFEFNGHKAN